MFEAYDPNGPKTRSNDPILSIYSDGNSRLNVAAMERWFDDVERVRVLVDRGDARLAFDRDAEAERSTLSLSRRGNGGGDVHTAGALKDFGLDVDAHDETAHRELREHEQTGYIVRGTLTFLLDGEEHGIHPGESYVVPAEEEHGAENRSETPVEGVDIFSPPRENPPWAED